MNTTPSSSSMASHIIMYDAEGNLVSWDSPMDLKPFLLDPPSPPNLLGTLWSHLHPDGAFYIGNYGTMWEGKQKMRRQDVQGTPRSIRKEQEGGSGEERK
jgi:hypothetical protein